MESDPNSAFVLAYDAARYALTGLLAQQGLRPTSKGGHYVIELAMRPQFGNGFRQFSALRRRRNELEYPQHSSDEATKGEAQRAVDASADIITAATRLIGQLGLFQ